MNDLKQNITNSAIVASLEPYIDGAKIQSELYISPLQAKELFKDYAIRKKQIDPDVFSRSISNIELIHAIDLLQNPYLKNVKLPPFESENLKLETVFYEKNEFAMLNEPVQTTDLLKKFAIGIFDDSAYTYVLKNSDHVWMSICPMEINTMNQHIHSASGKVLVLGGGLAYYPYMISLKDNISEITIVESDERIYNLIKGSILPQFPNKKSDILLADAEAYISETDLSIYDTIFFDIWKDGTSGADYMKNFVKYEIKYPSVHFQYWLENSMLNTFTVNISEYFNAKLGTEEYQALFKRVAPDLWNYMESIPDVISRPDQVEYYLTQKFAKNYLLGIKKS